MDCSSWNSSLHAYGRRMSTTVSPDRQYWHQFWYCSRPHARHTLAEKASDECMSRSMMRLEAPYATKQSRSISPSRSPPSRERPSVGCRVNTARGPRARACALSNTMCLSFW